MVTLLLGVVIKMEERVMPRVFLLGYTKSLVSDNPESIVACAGKLCYSKSSCDDIMKKMDDEEVCRFVSMLSTMGHESVLEHISFTFAIDGISRTCSHQLVRHRIASYSQQSQRYVDLKDTFSYIIPEEIYNNEEARKLYVESMNSDFDNYKKITKALHDSYVLSMDERSATKKAIEDARFALPNACETKVVMTMNARSLLNFFSLRMCNRAQWEIREVAGKMLDLVMDVAPHIFAKAGAPCTFGKCNEGKMSCGNRVLPNDKQRRLIKD